MEAQMHPQDSNSRPNVPQIVIYTIPADIADNGKVRLAFASPSLPPKRDSAKCVPSD
jgi:hypothetical protein